MAKTENSDQALHYNLVRNYTACPNLLFDKDSMITRDMDMYVDLSQYVSTVCPSGKNAQTVGTDQHMHL